MSTHNIGFYEELTKIIIQLSSNRHIICYSKYEPRCEKTGLRDFRPGLTQTRL